MDDIEWEIDKVISKLKVIHPDREFDRKEIIQKLVEMKNRTGHITYPIAGLKWNQLNFENEREDNIDLPFSACLGTDCLKRKKCLRYELFKNIQDGNTCIVPIKPCKSFIPINGKES